MTKNDIIAVIVCVMYTMLPRCMNEKKKRCLEAYSCDDDDDDDYWAPEYNPNNDMNIKSVGDT